MKSKAKLLLPITVAAVVLLLFLGTLWFLWAKSRPKAVGVQTDKPFVAEVVKKTVAAGTIGPRKEVEIKPKVSGILKTLYVEPGKIVKAGDLIADVQIIPDVVNLNEAELRLKSAQLAQERAKRELDRAETLGGKGAAALGELDRLRSDHQIATEELEAARNRIQLLRVGALRGAKGGSSTRVEATADGMILAILVREGNSVINANSFNPGTTVALVADMNDLLFKGRVDESEVGRLREGMPVEIVVGALEDKKFEGKLTYIAPKSATKEGATEFEIEAAFRPPQGITVRAGYSANANIVLDRRDKVLVVNESLLTFEGDKPFVEVQVAPDTFEKRPVKLGLSDGIKAEVLDGIKPDAVLKKPVKTEPAPGGGRPPGGR
jgi:HlyD family secretion protein